MRVFYPFWGHIWAQRESKPWFPFSIIWHRVCREKSWGWMVWWGQAFARDSIVPIKKHDASTHFNHPLFNKDAFFCIWSKLVHHNCSKQKNLGILLPFQRVLGVMLHTLGIFPLLENGVGNLLSQLLVQVDFFFQSCGFYLCLCLCFFVFVFLFFKFGFESTNYRKGITPTFTDKHRTLSVGTVWIN